MEIHAGASSITWKSNKLSKESSKRSNRTSNVGVMNFLSSTCQAVMWLIQIDFKLPYLQSLKLNTLRIREEHETKPSKLMKTPGIVGYHQGVT